MSLLNNNYNGSSMNGLNNSFSNMSFQQAGGAPYSSIPVPPPLPAQKSFNNNSFLSNRNLYTRDWNQLNNSQWGTTQGFQSFAAPSYTQTSTFLPATSLVQSAPVAAVAAQPMLPAPINDGRRYARLTGQKAGSRRSRRHLVQPLNQTGLTTLPAGIPVEGLAAASAPVANGSRRSRGGRGNRRNNGNFSGGQAGLPVSSNYISLGPLPSGGSSLPLQQQQQFAGVPASTAYLQSAPLAAAPIAAAPIVATQPMLPAPINDGRRYARLTGQKAGSRRSRRHLVQPLNQTSLTTLPAGIPVEGLAAATAPIAQTNGRRSRTMQSRGLAGPLAAAPLVSAPIAAAPLGTTALAAPQLAQIPTRVPSLGSRRGNRRGNKRGLNNGFATNGLVAAPGLVPVSTAPVMSSTLLAQQPMIKQQLYTPVAQPSLVGAPTF